MHESFLIYRNFRWLKLSVFITLLAIIAYAVHVPAGAPNGGTWLGYTLGTIGALLILFLLWFGIRKRSYGSNTGTVQGWLSAHVYLGAALLVIATLHAGFQFGWNLHTLTYALMAAVIISGFFGVFAYVRYPALMTANRRGKVFDALLGEIADLDRECREATLPLSNEMNKAVLHSREDTLIGGGVLRQLSGHDPRCATTAALVRVREYAKQTTADEADHTRRLLVLLNKKKDLVDRLRRDIRFKAWMDVWLYLHVPLSIALLAALIAHIASVFMYW